LPAFRGGRPFAVDATIMERQRSARGFTLIEVTIAIGLLVVIAAGSAQMFAVAIRHNVLARQHRVMSLAAAR
jgi:prepilin-type N-terminal cleavage/methylation domain-containing protein